MDAGPHRAGADGGGRLGRGWVNRLAMCALAGIDPHHVVNACEEERLLLLEVADRVHKLVADANKKKK